MKHYSTADWADYANQAAPPEQRAAMDDHLQEGCKECRANLHLWQRVQEVANREVEYEPPESAVKFVKGAFALDPPRKRKPRVSEIAELVFDSFRQPLPAGVRSVETATRKLLYRWGGLQIDLNLEPLEASNRISIEGQMLDASHPSNRLKEIPVIVLSGKDQLGQTRTNQFGEFHVECKLEKNLELRMWIDEERQAFIPLGGLDRRISLGK